MTTIAWDGRLIAADGQRTYGDQIAGLTHQKLVVKGHKVFAFTGVAPLMSAMIDWQMAGADPANLPIGWDKDERGWSLILVDAAGVGKYSSVCPYLERFDPPFAFGAGEDYALGAMHAGADARQAIEIVSRITIHTGGFIQSIDVDQLFGRGFEAAAE